MSNPEAAIYSRLTAYAGLTALVSTRISPLMLPEKTAFPAVSFFLVSRSKFPGMGSDGALTRARIQVDCWGASYKSAKDVATQVRGALNRYRGTSGGVTVQEIMIESEGPDLFEDETGIYHVPMDFMMFFEE